jgi:hypothetical protein
VGPRRVRLARLGWASLGAVGALIVGVRFALRAVVRGQLTLDLGLGRSVRPLGPIEMDVAAPREIAFDAAAAPYGPRPPKDLRHGVEVLQRSSTMVLAAHRTPVGRDVAVTLEGVVLQRPERIEFRLVRGPVPHVIEQFVFHEVDGGTRLTYTGELGTDLWGPGRAWGDRVAAVWEDAVHRSMEQIRDTAVRRARSRSSRGASPSGSARPASGPSEDAS